MAVTVPTMAIVDAEEKDDRALAESRSESFVGLRRRHSLPGSPRFGCDTAPEGIYASTLGHEVPGM